MLRVRSHHYQGEAHPAARKAVLTVRVSDLLRIQALDSDAAAHKLRLLAGTRYEAPSGKHAEGSLKIACERFPHEAQNLRWVAERVQLLCKEANVSQTLGSMKRGGRSKAGAARAGARTQVLRPAAPQEMVSSSGAHRLSFMACRLRAPEGIVYPTGLLLPTARLAAAALYPPSALPHPLTPRPPLPQRTDKSIRRRLRAAGRASVFGAREQAQGPGAASGADAERLSPGVAVMAGCGVARFLT